MIIGQIKQKLVSLVDHPYDKATSDFIIFAPNHYQVISNGLLVEETNVNKEIKKTHWRQSVQFLVGYMQ